LTRQLLHPYTLSAAASPMPEASMTRGLVLAVCVLLSACRSAAAAATEALQSLGWSYE